MHAMNHPIAFAIITLLIILIWFGVGKMKLFSKSGMVLYAIWCLLHIAFAYVLWTYCF